MTAASPNTENQETVFSHFKDFGKFRFVRIQDSIAVYERFYDPLPNFIPLKNNTTNEVERCVFRIEIPAEAKNGKRGLKIDVFRHFPSGTDYGRHDVVDSLDGNGFSPSTQIYSENEFSIEDWSGKIFEGKKSELSIPEMLERFYQAHIRPCRKYAGLLTRSKSRLLNYLPVFTEKKFYPFVNLVLKFVCGKRLEFDHSDPESREEFLLEPIKYSRIKPIPELLVRTPIGYECSKPTAIWATLTILAAVGLLHFLLGVDRNSLLIALLVFITFPVFLLIDFVIPLALIFILNILIKNQYILVRNVRV